MMVVETGKQRTEASRAAGRDGGASIRRIDAELRFKAYEEFEAIAARKDCRWIVEEVRSSKKVARGRSDALPGTLARLAHRAAGRRSASPRAEGPKVSPQCPSELRAQLPRVTELMAYRSSAEPHRSIHGRWAVAWICPDLG